MATKKGLGKGIGALIPDEGIPEIQKDAVLELKINDISPNSDQPRKQFNQDALQELAESIKENGVIQPIIVAKRGTGYRIVAGERRWRASRLAGLKVIPAIVRDLTDQQTMEQALIENIQRQDLNPLEEAFAMDNLMKEHGLTQEALAKKLGKSRPAIANTLRLLNIEESLQDFIRNGDLSAGHARALLAITDKEEQKKAADVVMIKELSVRETEEYVKKILSGATTTPRKTREKGSNPVAIETKKVERQLERYFGTKVKLKVKDEAAGKGSIMIEYYSYDDLDRLLEMMNN
ncbi:MAG: ParB/RepB/Spo0J family partition protein [Clostridiales bacterium]|nr:ParB/RepB/Spo0J family partition protein [Clostridiales bacterium]